MAPKNIFENDGEQGLDDFVTMLLDEKKPAQVRGHLVAAQLIGHGEDPLHVSQVFTKLFERFDKEKKNPNAQANKVKEAFEQALKELSEGSLRPGTFIKIADGNIPGPKPRLEIITPDGQKRYPTLHPSLNPNDLFAGQDLFMDPQCAVVLGVGSGMSDVGHEALFVRLVPGTANVELKIRDEKMLFHASKALLEAVGQGEVKRQDAVLYCPQRRFAFDVVPKDADRSYRFVDSTRVPNIRISKDMGAVHHCLGWLIRRSRLLMFRPDLLDRFGIRRRASLLMVGGPGTGKTYSIKGFLSTFNEMIVERTGRTDVGSRVIRVKMSELLSEWLGVAEKNIDALFDDIRALASEPVETADGEKIILPIVAVVEEADGIAGRRSGNGRDGAFGSMDRILTTILQRLDDPVDEIGHLPVLLVSTTNRPDAIDGGMFRRLGGMVARFYRLDRDGFASVLGTKIRPDFPMASNNGCAPEKLRQQIIDDVVSCYWSPNGDDQGQIELTLADGTKETKYRRDFFSPALIEQAMSTTVDELAFAAENSNGNVEGIGLSAGLFIDSLNHHVDAIADNVRIMNISEFLDIPENLRIAQIRRLHSPSGHSGDLLD